jgi:hypothetical protein
VVSYTKYPTDMPFVVSFLGPKGRYFANNNSRTKVLYNHVNRLIEKVRDLDKKERFKQLRRVKLLREVRGL